MNCLGLDLSWTNTGIVVWNGKKVLHLENVKTTVALEDELRLRHIASRVVRAVVRYEPMLTAIEGYAYGRHNQMARMGELNGVVKYRLSKKHAIFITLPPPSLKMFGVGKGNATKKEMIQAASLYFDCPKDDNIADAFFLAMYAHDNYGALVIESE